MLGWRRITLLGLMLGWTVGGDGDKGTEMELVVELGQQLNKSRNQPCGRSTSYT